MNFRIALDREDDGRWIAEVLDLPGVLSYGRSREEALGAVKALALRVLADRLEHGEATPDLASAAFEEADEAWEDRALGEAGLSDWADALDAEDRAE